MKKHSMFCLLPFIVLTGFFSACSAADGAMDTGETQTKPKKTPTPIVENVSLTPGYVALGRGQSLQFQVNTDAGSLAWSVADYEGAVLKEGTIVTGNGLLTVGGDETAEILFVYAKPSGAGASDRAVVRVIGNEADGVAGEGISVSPSRAMLYPGERQDFTADGEVSWSVTGSEREYTIANGTAGTLTVAPDETAETLTVTASLESAGHGTANVTVLVDDKGVPIPANNGITVSPLTAAVAKGRTAAFTAYNSPDGTGPLDGVNWAVFGATTESTTISDGFLTVGAYETAAYLTVKASNAGGYGAAVVTVSDGGNEGPAVELSFNGLTANGTENTTATTELTLVFSGAISGLGAGDIEIYPGTAAIKGTLSGNDGTYRLGVSGISAETSITVSVSKTGYTIDPASKTVTVHKSNGPVMIQVPGGSFVRDDDKTVTVSGFQIGKYEVTQKEWDALMSNLNRRTNSSFDARGKGDNYPMYLIDWYEAVKYCNKLSDSQGLDPAYTIGSESPPSVTCDFTKNGYRLPTEAEWEYAARGGGSYTYSGSNNIDDVAWHGSNSDRTTHLVGQKYPNGYGLYDMNGNLWEWCWDWYGNPYSTGAEDLTDPTGPSSGTNRVNRGADWRRSPYNEEVSTYSGLGITDEVGAADFKLGFRHANLPGSEWDSLGLRVVRRPQ